VSKTFSNLTYPIFHFQGICLPLGDGANADWWPLVTASHPKIDKKNRVYNADLCYDESCFDLLSGLKNNEGFWDPHILTTKYDLIRRSLKMRESGLGLESEPWTSSS
jgi:hypothetical protein